MRRPGRSVRIRLGNVSVFGVANKLQANRATKYVFFLLSILDSKYQARQVPFVCSSCDVIADRGIMQ